MTIEKIITPYNRDVKTNRRIDYLVFHYTGTLAAALNNAKYYAAQKVGASAHYYLDEKPIIYQGVEDKDAAWHCGTTGKYVHPDCRNANSVGIEMVPRKVNGGHLSATDTDWSFAPATIDNAVALGRMLMKKYNIPIERVLRHYDVTGKICPNPFVVDAKAQAAWEGFKARLTAPEKEEEINMTKQDVQAMIDEAVQAAKPTAYTTIDEVPNWAQPLVKEAVDAGILRGDHNGALHLTDDNLITLQLFKNVGEF